MKASKITSFLLAMVLLFTYARAQANPIDSVLTEADEMPYFAGSETYPDGSAEKRAFSNQAVFRFISENLQLPEGVTQTGKIYVTFIVDESGKVQEPKILHGGDKNAETAILQVIKSMPNWIPAQQGGKPAKVRLNLPVKITEEDLSGGYRLSWGVLKTKQISKKEILDNLAQPLVVRDENGASVDVNELLFEMERKGKFVDATSNGKISDEQMRIVKKLKSGDTFVVTATVQKNGQFYYVSREFNIEN